MGPEKNACVNPIRNPVNPTSPKAGRKGALLREDVTFFHDLALAAEQAMSADAEKAMRVFAGL